MGNTFKVNKKTQNDVTDVAWCRFANASIVHFEQVNVNWVEAYQTSICSSFLIDKIEKLWSWLSNVQNVNYHQPFSNKDVSLIFFVLSKVGIFGAGLLFFCQRNWVFTLSLHLAAADWMQQIERKC